MSNIDVSQHPIYTAPATAPSRPASAGSFKRKAYHVLNAGLIACAFAFVAAVVCGILP